MKKVACIGNFDGVHQGHQLLIERVVELANNKFIPTVITFNPDHEIIFSNKEKKFLTTLKQKKDYMYMFGIKEIIIIPFTKEVSYISKEKFLEEVLNRLDLDTLVCGRDFTFGHKGEGNSDYLTKSKKKNFKVEIMEHILFKDEKISSTLISNLISEGNLDLAKKLLNHDYYIEASILNNEISTENIIPKKGEYNVLINSKKYLLKDKIIKYPDKKKVKIVFI